jgi:hypothetical protein
MILSEAPLPYISAVSKRVTPSAMLARKAFPTSLRSYSLPYPQSLVVPHAQRSDVQLVRKTNCKLALQSVSSHTFASILRGGRGVWAHSHGCGIVLEPAPTDHYHPTKTIAESRIDSGS